MTDPDVIDALAGLTPESQLARIRHRKPITRDQAQASYRALFEAAETSDVAQQERFAVALFVAGLHDQAEAAAFYSAGLARTAASEALVTALSAEIARAHATGPYGAYPKGKLTKEDVAGPSYTVAQTEALGPRLSAALAHVHMLVFHPRDASPRALQRLLDAGWSNTGIVTLSQLVAFLAFQIRAAAGLRTLAATPGSAP
jgi:CMD domain protein